MSTARGRAPHKHAAILAALAVACAAPAAHAAASASLRADAAAACAATIKIAGKSTCLVVGKSCKPKYASKYAAKGFSCKRDAKGRYRLKKSKQSF